MMHHLLVQCEVRGIRLAADGDRLAIDAPVGALTTRLVAELRQHKAALLAALTRKPAPGPPVDSTPTGPGRPAVLPGDLGGLMMPDGEWDELPDPEPCRACGGIDCWWGWWNERHCSVCKPSGQRSQNLAGRAARLRTRAK